VPAPSKDELLVRVDVLIAKFTSLRVVERSRVPDRFDAAPFAEWRTQSLAFLKGLLAPGHAYVEAFEREVKPPGYPTESAAGLGILRAVREDIESGYLSDLRQLVSAEVFGDFLDIADHLNAEGYYHAAASLAGAVLEDSLRRALRARGQLANGNLQSFSQVGFDAGMWSPIVHKQLKFWIDVRDKADHAEWDQVDPASVTSMIRDLPGFLSTALGL
jgi:hypothetical protein